MNRRLALFISHYSIDNSPSIINVIEQFSRDNHVTLFLRRVTQKNSPVIRKENIEIVTLDTDARMVLRSCRETMRFLGGKKFDAAICFDPQGFVLCLLVTPYLRPVYYSLELYVSNDHFGLRYPWWVARLERSRINAIRGLIIQSREKDEIIRRDYGLSPAIPTFLLPVTYRGESSPEKSDFLRSTFRIPAGVKLALHLGGIAEWFSCIELARSFAALEDWALVFHGYALPRYLDELERYLRDHDVRNVYIHREQYQDLREIEKVVRSCDVGIAWYNDISVGFRTAGHSSGKIPAYLRFGLPVVAKRYRSTYEAIESVGAGLCVDSFDEIPAALARISPDAGSFSTRARDVYDRFYNFERYAEPLEDFVWSCKRSRTRESG